MLSKYSVKKPYTVLVGVLLVIVLGIVSLMKMTTDLLPNMSFQYALVITTDVGASPEQVESDVTAPIEAAMATTSNIKNITSTSYNSYSLVVLEYEQNANMDSVVIEIQQKLDQLSGSFADSVGTPMIMQINPDMLPIMIAAVDVEGLSELEIADYVNNELIPSLESIEGVASVSANGGLEEKVEVTMNQSKIDALNEKIEKALDEKFGDAQKELDDASQKIEDGKKALEKGQKEMAQKLGEASNEIENNRITIAQTKSQLTTQLQLMETLSPMIDEIIPQLNNLYTEGMKTKQQMETMTKALSDSLTQAGANFDPGQLNDLVNNVDTNGRALEEFVNGYLPADSQLHAVDGIVAELMELKKTMANVQNGLNGLKKAVNQFGVVFDSLEEIPKAITQLQDTKKQLDEGIIAIKDGLNQLEDGQTALNNGAQTFVEGEITGILQMANGYADLTNAAAQLEAGKAQLEQAKDSAYAQANLNNVLTIQMLSQLLVAQNFDMPAGYAYKGDEQFLIRVGEGVETVDDLRNLVLMDFGMDEVGVIHLCDVADIEIVDNSDETYAIVNGNPGIMLQIEKQTGYSTGDVTDRLLDKFDALEKANDALHMSVLMNQGIYIDIVVESLFQNMIFGAILAIFVLLLFLKDVKPTVVIACSIPLSVIVAVVLMYFTGISMNIISMSGLVLGIGMLVDNSIVVIENIYRLRGEGYSIKKAAVEGASQVAGAIVASTLTTISVYAPIIFTDGITRQLFVDLALTIAYTLVASLVVALTFVPAMGSAILNKTKEIKHPWFDRFQEWYGKILAVCLKHKGLIFLTSLFLLGVSAALSLSRGLNFLDMDMETDQLSVSITALKDETLEFEELVDCSNEVIERISDIEGIDTIGAMIGGGSTMSLMGGGGSDSVSMYVLLDENSKASIYEVAEEIENRTADMNCQVKTETNSMDMTSFMGSGISVQIKGRDLDTLQELAAEVAKVVGSVEGTVDVNDGLDNTASEFAIIVDKEKAAEYGYTVAQVFQLVYAKMAGSTAATTIQSDIKDYAVYVQTEVQANTLLSDIEDITFIYTDKEGNEEEVALKEICTMKEKTTLSTIKRDSQTRYLTVSAAIDADHNVTLVSNEIQRGLERIQVPEGYTVSMTGEDENINEAMGQLVLMLLLAVVFIYLIMVAQFQSLLSPFIIMFSIPLAFTGGFAALYFTKTEVSVIAMLGFIMLAGLIVNNGIVLIDYINQARREGKSKFDAIIESGKTRLRPILMTALTTILAMLTSALGIGDGSAMMKPMAITIVGGLAYGTVLTLVIIPCLYDVFNKEKNMVEEEL